MAKDSYTKQLEEQAKEDKQYIKDLEDRVYAQEQIVDLFEQQKEIIGSYANARETCKSIHERWQEVAGDVKTVDDMISDEDLSEEADNPVLATTYNRETKKIEKFDFDKSIKELEDTLSKANGVPMGGQMRKMFDEFKELSKEISKESDKAE